MAYVSVKAYASTSAYTEKAIRRKIEKKVWVEGQQYRRSPDGRIQISTTGVKRWIEGKK